MFIGIGLGLNMLRGGSSVDSAFAALAGTNPYMTLDFAGQSYFKQQAQYALASVPGYSFTRASAGYAQNATGLLLPFLSGAPRVTDKGVLVEGARTNLLLYCRDFTNAAWVKTNATAALDQIGMDGVAASASSLLATSALATVLQTIVSASTGRATTCYVKRLVGTGTIEFTEDGISYTDITAQINASTYTRITLTGTILNPVVGFRITTSGDKIAVDFGQCESAAFASSPILTTSASATRAADVLTFSSVSGAYPWGLYDEFERVVDTGGIEYLATLDASTNERSHLLIDASDKLNARTVSGGVTDGAAATAASVSLGVHKSAGRLQANNVQACLDGTLATADVATTGPTAPTTFRIGLDASNGSSPFGYIRRAALFNAALADARLQALTT